MSARIRRSAAAADADATADPVPASAWTLHCDGSALPNPGRMGLGAVLLCPDGRRHAFSVMPAGSGCNNEAELRALCLGMSEAKALGATELLAFSDNSVLVEQLGRRGQRPILRLAMLVEAARAELDAFAWWRLRWIRAIATSRPTHSPARRWGWR